MRRHGLTRREFLEASAVGAAGAAGALSLGGPLFAQAAAGVNVWLVRGGDSPAALVDKALELMGGMGKFIKKDETVLVKPNIGFDRKPEFAASTNPEVFGAIVRHCLKAGAKEVRVFDNTCNNDRRCAESSGIKAATAAAGGKFDFINPRRFKTTKIVGATRLKEWDIYPDALSVDAIINVPIAKQHGISMVTLCLKNWMGLVGGKRGEMHQAMPESLCDLHRVFGPKTRLYMIDAWRTLLRNGPSGGRLEDVKETKTLIASTDPIACEAVAMSLFKGKPEKVPTIVAGHKAGFGEMDLSKIHVETVDVG